LWASTNNLLVGLSKIKLESITFLRSCFYEFWLKGDDKAEVLSKAMDKSADHINTVLKYLVVLCIQQNSD
jgi:hypothetical protein